MEAKQGYDQKTQEIVDMITHVSYPLNYSGDLDPLMDYIGDSKYVLLGEASHGTHEYYTWRAKISKRLIEEKGFSLIAVEGDWSDCYRVNRYVKNYPFSGQSAFEVLRAFTRWPTWMWSNWEILSFTEWMRDFNKGLDSHKRVGFYGLDVYSHWESMEAIVSYLNENDPTTLQTAIRALNCFERYSSDQGHSYSHSRAIVPQIFENEVIEMLTKMRTDLPHFESDSEQIFCTEQNAMVSENAGSYYRTMIKGGANSWNARDKHMNSTLQRLMNFYGKDAKCIVWEHNSHVGDARATDMANEGMLNLGQLVKEEHDTEGVVTVGFGTYQGHVIAGREWNDDMQEMIVPRAIEGSWEDILHKTYKGEDKLLMLNMIKSEERAFAELGHRAIGAIYQPMHERYGNYVSSMLPMRYNAFLFIDKTTAINPLHQLPTSVQDPETDLFDA